MDRERMLVTASGTFMGNLAEGDFAEVEITTGVTRGSQKASKETPMHRGIYQKREDVGAIVHASPFYTTLFSCSDLQIESALFIETMYYLENIAYVDYHHPGTQELGDAVAEQARGANIIIMRNHGVVVCDDSVSEALMRLETLELACRMILQAKTAGVSLKRIPEHMVSSFLQEGKYKPRKRIGG
jgi:L-fuculose-phosphate aldolase